MASPERPSSRAPSHVVGIGASAGGLQALERFFDHLPPTTEMAFVVIQHLSPDFKSLMDELLARHTALPVNLVEDGMQIEAGRVYLIPPKKEMIISDGRLLLSERSRQTNELQLPIDTFFRSLAQDCGPRSVAIVLSGGGSDGSRGVRDVYERGGLVLVQDGASAQFDGMPKTAREAGVAHWVLSPEEMPSVLVEHAKSAASHPRAQNPAPPEGIDVVYQMLEHRFGLDFKHYKPTTVTRRIERRLQLAHASDIEGYVERLKQGREELDQLYRDLLIGVTRFFRNEAAFEALERTFLPELFRRGPADQPLRVWIAGCATGEEAYSLAIVLHELSAETGRPVKIFASDVHRGSLEIAARAIYDEAAVEKVSRERLERYFLKRGKHYQVVPDIRQMIVFAPHNVITDAPFTRVDLVSCRNLLIYLQPPAQQKVLSLFHFALNRGGLLFLGPSETPGTLTGDFETLDRHWHVYRKFSDVRTPVAAQIPRIKAIEPRLGSSTSPSPLARYSLTQLLATYDTLLDECMPPSLLLSERGELVHAFGGASKFLKLRDGRQDLDVLDVVDDELKMILAGGLKRAARESTPIVFRGLRAKADGEERTYDVTIRQVKTRASGVPHLLVSFDQKEGLPRAAETATEVRLDQVSQQQLGALEAELSYTKENLQAAIEELETSNEELQAANEELLASNEELQSTNEELQSVNEELYTVNSEYQRKIAELTELTNDMDNLLLSTDVGTIFLDRQLKIRKFTPPIAEMFSLLQQDVGRSIESFTTALEHPDLVPDLQRVLESGEVVERELRHRDGRAFFLRTLPYRAKGGIDGVVVTLIDVSGLKAAEDALFHERHLLNSLLTSVRDAIYFLDARGKIIRANDAMALRVGLRDAREAVGKTHYDIEDRQRATALADQDDDVLRTGAPQYARLEKRVDKSGEERWDVVTRLPMRDPAGRIVGVIAIFRDVTDEKRAEEKVREAVRRRDQFLAMLSHELRNPLGAVVTATALLQAQGPDSETKRNRMLDIVQRQSQQMARLLDDLLEASRVTQNKIELRKRVVDLRSVARDAMDAVRSSLDVRRIQLTLDLDQKPVCVDGDTARLQQIQVNLLSNAAKYTPPGGHVWFSVKREGEDAVVRVRDDGAGIAPEMLDAVFDLFVQSKKTIERSDGGLGVGLTLVRSLVHMHGGRVSATSAGEGKGSEFVVFLPLVPAPVDEVAPARSRLSLPRGAKVVIVEDNADSREMLCELLALSGFDCLAAGDGRAGLDLIRDVRPKVAIVDLGLPELDGYEIARALRDDPAFDNVYLIALTGYGQREDRAAALAAGFNEHLVKPVDADSLKRLLAAAETDRLNAYS